MDTPLSKAKLLAKGNSLLEADMEIVWIVTYSAIAERWDYDRKYGLERYPYEYEPTFSALLVAPSIILDEI